MLACASISKLVMKGICRTVTTLRAVTVNASGLTRRSMRYLDALSYQTVASGDLET